MTGVWTMVCVYTAHCNVNIDHMDMRDTGPRYLSITAAAPSLTGSQSASPASLPRPAARLSRVTRHASRGWSHNF